MNKKWELVNFCEFDKYAVKSYCAIHNVDESLNLGDITKVNEKEIAMFFKLFGRYENQVDNRDVLCKKCVCEQLGITKTEYAEKNMEFIEQGCNLF